MDSSGSRGRKAFNVRVLIAAVVAVAIITVGVTVWANEDSQAYTGTGTSVNDPFVLSSEADLSLLSLHATDNSYFALDSDITVIGNWTPVGTAANPFNGHLEGRMHTITLNDVTPSQYTGLFGYLRGADISNLQIVLNKVLTSSTTPPVYVGGLAGYIDNSTIYDISLKGAGISLTMAGAAYEYVGGLSGYVSNSNLAFIFTDVDVKVTVTGNGGGPTPPPTYGGGAIGYGINNIINASLSTGLVDLHIGSSQLYGGGFIGSTIGGAITNCGASGNVNMYNTDTSKGSYSNVGGFAGYSNTPITNAYARGNVTYTPNNVNAQGVYMGGLVGMSDSTITNAYFSGILSTTLKPSGSYNAGYITGTGSATNAYYLGGYPLPEGTSANIDTAGNSRTSAQLKVRSTFPAWSNNDWIWNGGYPDLAAFSFLITVEIDPDSSYGTINYSVNSPVTNGSPAYTNPIIGNPWETYYFEASPTSGNVFLRWSGGDDSDVFLTTTSVTVPVPSVIDPLGSAQLTAYFSKQSDAALLTVNALPQGSGTFTFNATGIDGDFPYTGPQYFANGTEIHVTAAPTGTYSFSTWVSSEVWCGDTTAGPIILPAGPTTLVALFTSPTDPTLTINASPPDAGSFTYMVQGTGTGGNWIGPINYSDPIKIPSGFNVSITAIPDNFKGYLFLPTGWSGAGTTVGQARQITGITGSPVVTATFTEGVIVKATAVPAGSGTFTFSTDGGQTYTARTGDQVVVLAGSQDVLIRATPNAGYGLSFWAGMPLNTSTISVSAAVVGYYEKKAYFYDLNNFNTVTTSVIGAGSVVVTVEGVQALAQSSSTAVTLNVTKGDSVTIDAINGAGDFMFYIGTITTTADNVQSTLGPFNIDQNYTEKAYFTNGRPTVDLDLTITGSGHAIVDIPEWDGSVDTSVFGNSIPILKVQVGDTVTITPVEDNGYFQDIIVSYVNASSTTITNYYQVPPVFTGVLNFDTTVTVSFTNGSDVYTLYLSASSGNAITYRLDGVGPWVELYFSDIPGYPLKVDKDMYTEIGYKYGPVGTYLFQHFTVDGMYSLAGPTAQFNDDPNNITDHTIRAMFTDDISSGAVYYTLTVNLHGIGSVTMTIGGDPAETLSSTGPTFTRTISADEYKPFVIFYQSGILQYAVYTPAIGATTYTYSNGTANQRLVDATNYALVPAGLYTVDVYFLDADSVAYTLSMSVVGNGALTFDIGNGPASLTEATGVVRIPLSSTDTATIGMIPGPGVFQFFSHTYGPGTTDIYYTVATMPTITSLKGDQTVIAHFTYSSTPTMLTLATYGSGYVTFTMDGITGRYKSVPSGTPFNLPTDTGDTIPIGYIEDAGVFQFYMIDGSVWFKNQASPSVTGLSNHTVLAYFTSTKTTFDLTIGAIGSGMIITTISGVDGVSANSVTISLTSSTVLESQTIPLDTTESATVTAQPILGHFQYYTVSESDGPLNAVQGASNGVLFDYPYTITVKTAITAMFTNDASRDYLLVMDVEKTDHGTMTYQVGSGPAIAFRGDPAPRELWVNYNEVTSIGYSDIGEYDGYFQYFIYEKNDDLSTAASLFSVAPIGGTTDVIGDKYVITAKFTDDKINVSEHKLGTVGDGYITFQVGGDPMGRYRSPVSVNPLDPNDPGLKILYVNKTDSVSVVDTTVNLEELDPANPNWTGDYYFDGTTYHLDPNTETMPDLLLGSDDDHTVVIYFDASTLTYTLIVTIHGNGSADVSDSTMIPDVISPGEYNVHVYGDVTITANNGLGLFQNMQVTINSASTWQASPYTIISGRATAGSTVYADVYFTLSDSVYYLNVYTETTGSITYNIDGIAMHVVPLQQTGIPVDLTSYVNIGSLGVNGIFQYFKYGMTGSTARTDVFSNFTLAAGTYQKNDSVDVSAYFTATNNTFSITIGTVGDGFITFTENRPVRQTETIQSVPDGTTYTIPFDVGVTVTVGWQESNLSISQSIQRFQYFEYTDALSNVSLERRVLPVSGASGSTYKTIAYFTTGPQYNVTLSTNINAAGGWIGLQIDMSEPPLWQNLSTPITVPVAIGTDVQILNRSDSAAVIFQFYVLNGNVTFPSTPDSSLDVMASVPGLVAGSNVSVIAYFADSTSYAVNLSTIGSGSISYKIGAYNTAYFRTSTSPGPASLDFRVNAADALVIGNTPDSGAAFTYYIYTRDAAAPAVYNAVPVLTGSYNGIVARFTGTTYYTLSLSATAGGSITYTVEGDPTGSYAGVAAMSLNLDPGTNVNIGYSEGASGASFRWFIQTVPSVGGVTSVTRNIPTITVQESRTIVAIFISNPYFVTLETIGDGSVTITIGAYTYAYQSLSPGESDTVSIPVSTTETATIGYREGAGHFQQFDYWITSPVTSPPDQSLSAPFNISTGSIGQVEYVKAYFTSGPTYLINLSRQGGGLITFTIGDRATVSLANAVTSPYALYVNVTDVAVIDNDPGIYAFQYYNCTGSVYSGILTDQPLPFPAGTTGTHSVSAVFTSNAVRPDAVYVVSLGTVGSGNITAHLSTMAAGQYISYQSTTPGDTYPLSVDSTVSVTIGHEETDGKFIGFTKGTDTLLSTVDTIDVSLSYADTYTAYFTNTLNDFSVTISTSGTGYITYVYDLLGVSGQYTGPGVTINADIGDTLTIGHSTNAGEYFNEFIVDGTSMPGTDTIVYEPAVVDETHTVMAVFTATSNVYTVILKTANSAGTESQGNITFSVPGTVLTGKYPGNGTWTEDGWPIYVDRGNSMIIGKEDNYDDPGIDAFFQYFGIAVGATQPTLLINNTYTVPAGTTGSRAVTAYFTNDATDVYKLTLATSGNGYITFSIDGGTTVWPFMSSTTNSSYVLTVDTGYTTIVGYSATNANGNGRFQFFTYNGDLVSDNSPGSTISVLDTAASITAYFTDTRSTYTLALAWVGNGHEEFSFDSNPSNILAPAVVNFTIPIDTGKGVTVKAVPDTGGIFRFFIYDAGTYTNNVYNVNESVSGSNHLITAYFAYAPAPLLVVNKTGVGQVNLSIVTGGVTVPTIVDFTGSMPMEPTDTVTLNAVETSTASKFVHWASTETHINGSEDPEASATMSTDDVTATALFVGNSQQSGHSYTIDASSDNGSTITPSGQVSVQSEGSMTFLFQANAGYFVSAVYVDGKEISADDLASGTYTFTNVLSNHTISVVSSQGRPIMVYVEIEGGKGTAEYRIGLSDQYKGFLRSQQIIQYSDLFITVAVDEGYDFVSWSGDVTSDNIELSFPGVTNDIHLVAHLKSDGAGSTVSNGEWAVLNIIFAVLALFIGVVAVISELVENKERRFGKAAVLRVIALIVGIVAVVIFFITEDTHLKMGVYDAWTPIAIGLFAVALILTVLSFRQYKN